MNQLYQNEPPSPEQFAKIIRNLREYQKPPVIKSTGWVVWLAAHPVLARMWAVIVTVATGETLGLIAVNLSLLRRAQILTFESSAWGLFVAVAWLIGLVLGVIDTYIFILTTTRPPYNLAIFRRKP